MHNSVLTKKVKDKRDSQVKKFVFQIFPTALLVSIIALFVGKYVWDQFIKDPLFNSLHPSPTPTVTLTPTLIPSPTATFTPTATNTPTPTPSPLTGKSNWDGSVIYKYPSSLAIAQLEDEDQFEIWGWCRKSQDDPIVWLFIRFDEFSGWIYAPYEKDNFVPVLLPAYNDSSLLIRTKGLIELLPSNLKKICPQTGTLTPEPSN